MNTFRQMGVPFPLHDAPIDSHDDGDYFGLGTCSVCEARNSHCFRLGVGSYLVIACSACGVANGLNVYDAKAAQCRHCGKEVPFNSNVAGKREPKICYACLRAGKVALTKDTEFGMISFEQAISGVTNGVPGLQQDQFESVVFDDEEDWRGAKVPTELLWELMKTPGYGTWQGERWLFCCRHPMTFVGEWERDQFDAHSPDGDGSQFCYSVLTHLPENAWDAIGDAVAAYVFQCKQCGRFRGHWDCD